MRHEPYAMAQGYSKSTRTTINDKRHMGKDTGAKTYEREHEGKGTRAKIEDGPGRRAGWAQPILNVC